MNRKNRILVCLVCIVFVFVSEKTAAQESSVLKLGLIPLHGISVFEEDLAAIQQRTEKVLASYHQFRLKKYHKIANNKNFEGILQKEKLEEADLVFINTIISCDFLLHGNISRIGSNYQLEFLLFRTENFRLIKTELIKTDDLKEMASQIEVHVEKLATFLLDDNTQIKKAEFFIKTSPLNAVIKINGEIKGESPLLVQKLEPGNYLVEAEAKGMRARKRVKLDAGAFLQSELILENAYGRLLLKEHPNNLLVYLDEKLIGKTNQSLFTDIAVGKYQLKITGSEYFYQQEIIIKEKETSIVLNQLIKVGNLHYLIPKNCLAEFILKNEKKPLQGEGKLEKIPVGEYLLSIQGKNYKSLSRHIRIKQGETYNFKPQLEFSAEYKAYLKQKESNLQKVTLEIALLEKQLRKKQQKKGLLLGGRFGLLGTGGCLLAFSGIFLGSALQAYQNYQTAETAGEARFYREKAKSRRGAFIASFISGFVSAGGGGALFIIKLPELSREKKRVQNLKRQKKALDKNDSGKTAESLF